MENTISMQDMKHLNLFEKMTGVRTRYCFRYNDFIIFCVPRHLVSVAIGEEGRNVKRMSEILRRKIKVIPAPTGIYSAKQFIGAIVHPVKFRDINIGDNEIIITAGSMSKAALIGRNKRRLLEMQKIIKDYFGREFRVI